MSDLTPALTAEQWSKSQITNGGVVIDGDYYAIEHGGLHINYTEEYGRYFVTGELPTLIALANAALPDGDPRKITRGDVELLQVAEKHADDFPELLTLAAKLAALLPP